MALFDIRPDTQYDATMKRWKDAADNLSIGDTVLYNTIWSYRLYGNKGIITGTIKSFLNWHTVEVVTEDGHKWGVNVDLVDKIEKK